jgi:hypothetical protein
MVATPASRSLRCLRCGGRMLKGEDAFSCLACGHQDYGPGFEPLSLTLADAKRALSESAKTDSPYRTNDQNGWPV